MLPMDRKWRKLRRWEMAGCSSCLILGMKGKR